MSKQVLITGCSSGIGRYSVAALAKAGCSVFATARKLEAIEDLKGPNVAVHQLDVTDADSIKRAVAAALVRGPIDVLLHNAGYGQMGPVVELTHRELLDQFETNVFGVMELTKLVVHGPQGMIARRSGRIVMISSIVSQVAIPYSGAYCGSKFALRGLSDTLRLELAPFGIKVVQVEPGSVQSSFGNNAVATVERLRATQNGPYEVFRSQMEARYQRSQRKTTPTEVAAEVVVRACTARRPSTRYTVTNEARALRFARHILPDKALDSILARVFGLNRNV